MKSTIHKLKSELKGLASTITESNKQFKQGQRTGDWKLEAAAGSARGQAQYEFRHKHIVRCLLRGRAMEQIETLPKAGRCEKRCVCCNKPDQKYIDQLLEKVKNETLYCDPVGSVEVPASSAELSRSGDVDHGTPAALVGSERIHDRAEGPGSEVAGGFINRVQQALQRLGISRA